MTCYEALCDGVITDFAPMNSANTITWANNPKKVKIAGGNSVWVGLVEDGVAKKIVQKQRVPELLPGGADVPIEFLGK